MAEAVYTRRAEARPGGFRRAGEPPVRREAAAARLLWGAILLLSVILLAELVFHFLLSPRLKIRHVVVRGDMVLPREEILRMAGLAEGELFFSVKPEEVRRRLEAVPAVLRAEVQRVFPDTLRLELAGRRPLLFALADGADGSVAAVIDEEGMIYATGSDLPDRDLPLVSGLTFYSLAAGIELPGTLLPFLRQMRDLQTGHPDLYRLISEVRVVPVNQVSFELLVYPVVGSTRIRFANTLGAEALKGALLVLDLLRTEGIGSRVREIDLRTPEVVYRMEEEQPVGGR